MCAAGQGIKALAEAASNGTRDTHAFSQVVRRTVGRWVNTQHRRRLDHPSGAGLPRRGAVRSAAWGIAVITV